MQLSAFKSVNASAAGPARNEDSACRHKVEVRGAPNRLQIEFVYSNLMLNSISLAARNVRILLTCLWIHLYTGNNIS